MGRYTGCQCIACQKNFKSQEDDIVVCPTCGTPYHRSCWQEKGSTCINTALHAVGGSWQSIEDAHRTSAGGIACPACGYINLPDAKTCSVCETPLTTPESDAAEELQQMIFNASDPCCGMSPEDDMEGERLGDVASFVQNNTLYYIPLFRHFRDSGMKASVNLPCALFPYFYFANRKMWFMAIITGVIWMICNLPRTGLAMLWTLSNASYAGYTDEMIQFYHQIETFLTANQTMMEALETPFFILDMIMRVLLCLFGNYLYFRYAIRSVRKIREMCPTAAIRKAILAAEGGTNAWNILGCCGLFCIIGMLAYKITLAIFG